MRGPVWDTAGQERFRTLTSSYYRGAQAIIFVYDVTRRETLDSLEDVWIPEVDTFKTLDHPAIMVVGNKADLVSLLLWHQTSALQPPLKPAHEMLICSRAAGR